MKQIAIVGATQGVGRAVLDRALERGDAVTALARTPAKLAIEHENLRVISGDVLDPAAAAAVVEGADVVVVSLGNTPNNPDDVVSRGTAQVMAAMEAAGVGRLIVVTSIGVGDSSEQVPFAFRMLMKTVLRKAMADKEQQEALVRASSLDWTIVRPGGLTDGPATGRYRAGTEKDISAGQVARADVAAFILEEIDSGRYLRQTPAIS